MNRENTRRLEAIAKATVRAVVAPITMLAVAVVAVNVLVIAAMVGPATMLSMVPAASTVLCGAPPIGAANLPPDDPEPGQPIWCLPDGSLGQAPQTGGDDGHGGWVDNFQNGVSGAAPAHFTNELGYTTQENIVAGGGTSISLHWLGNGYFVADLAKTANLNGSNLTPNQSVRFENGKLVLEADVAAGIPGSSLTPGFTNAQGGDEVWPEIVWSTQRDASSIDTDDGLYSYGYYKGATAGGCRLQATRSLTCALEADHNLASTTNDSFPCFSQSPARMIEMSGHQQCGNVHSGFSVDFGAPSNAWRVCPSGTVDPCLDRFRLEWTKTGFVAYVNGIEFARDTGWPAQAQIPDAIVNGTTPVFAHFADWGDGLNNKTYRIHWARVAANPHNPDGSIVPPSASCQFLNTCGAGTPTPTPSPSASPSATPTPSPSPSGSPTPTPSPTAFPCNLRYANPGSTTFSGHPGTCRRQADGTISFRAN